MTTSQPASETLFIPAKSVVGRQSALSTETYIATVEGNRLVRVRYPGFMDATYFWVTPAGDRLPVQDPAWARAMYRTCVAGLPWRVAGR